jgi:L-lysine 6-transaminase
MSRVSTRSALSAQDVHAVLASHMLADGYDLVLDLDKSRGRRLHDARRDRTFLDLFSCFATVPLGYNHPKMRDSSNLARLQRAALTNPTNSDVYTIEMAEFVETFAQLAMPSYLPRLFLVAGGSVAVENALKAAFDWKIRRNFRKGLREERGRQALHFREAFHGRTGYTLSLTNTADPRKYELFPKFDWPRVDSPKLRFPVDAAEIERVKRAEADSLAQIRRAFEERQDDIACIIIEPIQAEGGDNHFRAEFLRALRAMADEHEALLIFDEVQTGMGPTGKMWGHQHDDVRPDLLAFGKKTQVCGVLAGGKLDEEPENVFRVPSRINSTWGGNLVDMVRCQRYLEIMEEEGIVENAARVGERLLKGLQGLAAEFPGLVTNPRGRGLMCAVDLSDADTRDRLKNKLYEMNVLILGCGIRGIRFRPALDITGAEADEALDLMRRALKTLR